eukprot:scaffold97288_cov69-Phaeocystis_antarctica.AAC.2
MLVGALRRLNHSGKTKGRAAEAQAERMSHKHLAKATVTDVCGGYRAAPTPAAHTRPKYEK